MFLSIWSLGGFLWVVFGLLPRAIVERDRLAVAAAVVTALAALWSFLWIGVGVRT